MRLLDLFCGAGGAAMGYSRAGFAEIVGVDNRPQKNYPFTFIEDDALAFLVEHGDEFDVIHASPPCQAYTIANNIHGHKHPRYIWGLRFFLRKSHKPYVIENVPQAPLWRPALVCGRALKLNVKRHRLFESNVPLISTTCPKGHPGDWLLVFGQTVLTRGKTIGYTKGGKFAAIRRQHVGTELGQRAMGINWMTRVELSESIPPAYTEFIGAQVLKAIG